MLPGSKKTVLLVLFVPSHDRRGTELDCQSQWVDAALERLGSLFGGATAYPRAEGVWRDGDDEDSPLVRDTPVVMHCYCRHEDIDDERKLTRLGEFCREMGQAMKQGEVGLIIQNEYYAIAISDGSTGSR